MWKRKRMRQYLSFVVMAFCVIGLIGCQKEVQPETIEITLMHGFGGTLESYKKMQEIYDEFSEQNPDIKLNCVAYMDNEIAVEKANDMLAVGKMPDILSTNSLSYMIDNAVKTGKALDLMPYIEKDSDWKANIHPSVFETWETENGELYTMPDVLEMIGYWYNEEYLKEAGIVKEDGTVKIPRTWGEFLETTEKLQNWIDETGKDISVFSFEKDQLTEFVFFARLAGDGPEGLGSVQNPQNGISKMAVGRTLDDMGMMRNYSEDVNNIEEARQRFVDGKTVIYFNGVWESEELSKSLRSGSFEYAAYPSNSGESISYVSPPSGYVLAKQDDKKKEEACIRFLKYMMSDTVQKKIAVETGQVPCNPQIDLSHLTDGITLLEKAVKVVNQADIQIPTGICTWNIEENDILGNYLLSGINDLEMREEMLMELGAK